MNRHLAVALIRLTLTVAFVFVMFDVLQTTWRRVEAHAVAR
jgi:hypothetical protein